MKENSVLKVLMYLFRNHMQENCRLDENSETLFDELQEVGFVRPAIHQAIVWLTNLIAQESTPEVAPSSNSFRVFSDYERDVIPTECQNLILSLEQQNILNPETRELVIHQILDLESEGIDQSLVKWVTLMVLFNKPSEAHALQSMEFFVLDNTIGGIH